MARIETHGLRRSVGLGGLFATAYGNVGSSIYYALGLVAAYALGLTPIVFLLAGGLFALTAKTYAEGASMYPEAGGSSSFARHAFNEFVSFFAGWALSLDYILTIAISAFFVPHYLGAFFPALRHSPGDVIGGIAVIIGLAALNIRGIGESAKLNFILALVDLATQVIIICVGIFLVLNPSLLINQVHLGTVPTYSHLIFALSLAMLAYTGIETVSNMAEEARDPGHDVPRAVNLILIAVIGVYAGITVVALSALPVIGHGAHAFTQLGGKYQNDPVLGIIDHLGLPTGIRHVLRYYVGILAATILFIATNAGLIGISRLSWSLAEHRQLPPIFAQLHRRYRTPWFTIVLFSVFAALLLIPGQTAFLGNLYSFGAMLSFTIAHAVDHRAAGQAARPRAAVPDPLRDPVPRCPDSAERDRRGPRHVRRVGVGDGSPRRRAVRRDGVDDRRARGLRRVPATIGHGPDLALQDRPPRAAARSSSSSTIARRSCRSSGPISTSRRCARRPGSSVRGHSSRRCTCCAFRASCRSTPACTRRSSRDSRCSRARSSPAARRASRSRPGSSARATPATRSSRRPSGREAEIIYLATDHAPDNERALGPTATYLLAHRPCRVVIETPPVPGARPAPFQAVA